MKKALDLVYERAPLTGFDNNYIQPEDADEQDILKPDNVIHFHPDHFTANESGRQRAQDPCESCAYSGRWHLKKIGAK